MLFAFLAAGIAILVIALTVGRWLVTVEPRVLLRMGRNAALAAAAALVVILVLVGRIDWLVWLAIVGLPVWVRLLHGIPWTGNRTGGRAPHGEASEVRTRFLRMSLDHDSGAIDGEVLEGPFAGRALSTLSVWDLSALLDDCRAVDVQSTQVLEAYLDRVHPDWRQRQGPTGHGPSEAAMTPEEAYAVLGLDPGADADAIREAYHRLISALHPDKGGSNYLAARINQARRVLLGR